MILAIDPGTDKCGLAVVAPDGAIVSREIVPTRQVPQALSRLLRDHALDTFLIGDGTSSRKLQPVVREALGERAAALQVVTELHTTERARVEYWKLYPPRGWRRLVPLGLQVPPVPLDDLAAVMIARDYLAARAT